MPARKIEKKLIPVVIYTATHKIEGFYHAFDNGGRLLDDLNEQQRDFLPLTDVRMVKLAAPEGDRVVAKFLAVNRQSIVLFFPNPKVAAQDTRASDRRSDDISGPGRRFEQSPFVPGLVMGAKDE
jgi:hypothetical protein